MVTKIGVSIPWCYLIKDLQDKESEALLAMAPNPERLLRNLAKTRVNSIELRYRPKDITKSQMREAINLIKKNEFNLTIHGDNLPKVSEIDIFKFFPWIKILEQKKHYDEVVVVLHPYPKWDDKTKEELSIATMDFIQCLLDQMDKVKFPIKLVLENQRQKNETDPCVDFEGVNKIVNAIKDPRLGTCWDVGHSTSNAMRLPKQFPMYADEKFLANLSHMHIHDMSTNKSTHWPFIANVVPIEEIVALVDKHNFNGAYNLELSFDRFKNIKLAKEAIFDSVSYLKEIIQEAHAKNQS